MDALLDTSDLQRVIAGKHRVELLKQIENHTAHVFATHDKYSHARNTLGGDQERLLQAALHQQWTDIAEYSPQFFSVYDACSQRQQLQRAAVRVALQQLQHGFNPLEHCLLYHASIVADAYDAFYKAWAQSVQGNATAAKLTSDEKAGTLDAALFNHYTIISLADDGQSYTQVPYYEHLSAVIDPILAAMDTWIAELQKLEDDADADVAGQYIEYLQQYRVCLGEWDVGKLEAAWKELDVKWMAIKYWIQIVHDIEYGYGDPLRCKVEPEFSCRLLDETYGEANKTIAKIQGVMVEYFKHRSGPLAKQGLAALQQSMAGIYYLPFLCAAPLHFRFSGQAIPNRSEVRAAHGVKIYFDPVATAAREDAAKALVAQVASDPAKYNATINTVDSIVYHVASHEYGHSIYGLDGVKHVIKSTTKTLLEEPRAELTALHTLRLITAAGMISGEAAAEHLLSFMLQDLRRFAHFGSSATWPYTLSAMGCWQRAAACGYLTLADEKVTFHHDQADAFLESSSALFTAILDAEDRMDGAAIEEIRAKLEAAEASQIVTWLKQKLYTPSST